MRNDRNKDLYETIKQEIRSILISSPKIKCGGLSGSLLFSDYKKFNCGKEIPYVQLGFHSFLSLLRSMPDVVQIRYLEDQSSYRVQPVFHHQTAHIHKMVLEQRDPNDHQDKFFSREEIFHNSIRPLNLLNSSSFISRSSNREMRIADHHNEIFSTANRSVTESPNFAIEEYYLSDSHQINDEDFQEERENVEVFPRIRLALNECIQFRYVYRLCQIEFECRHFPSTSKFNSIKKIFREKSLKEFHREWKDLDEWIQSSQLIDDDRCLIFFDEYVHLKRHFHYMNRFIRQHNEIPKL